jgi:hypothetical protein
MIETFTIFHGKYDLDVVLNIVLITNMSARGHHFKIKKINSQN